MEIEYVAIASSASVTHYKQIMYTISVFQLLLFTSLFCLLCCTKVCDQVRRGVANIHYISNSVAL